MTEETEIETGSQEVEQKESPAVELNINDLVAIRSIIEVASQRGSFKANELEAVGKTFNKLNSFLESVAAAKKEE